MSTSEVEDAEPFQLETLTIDEVGLWVVKTLHSRYHFDMDLRLVTRFRGEFATRTINDITRPIDRIVHCTVGSPGFWFMLPEGVEAMLFEDLWQLTTPIVSITRVDEFDLSP